ncbi:MAG: AzlC family ABC transporter permease [Spirochaetes bacterium]|nr:AzlC family ABC transporter permease [Spirochaetota bacterium]
MNSANIKEGFKNAIPIMSGYFPIAAAYGLLAASQGISFLETVSMSLIVFAGAAQFIAVQMLSADAAFNSIASTVFLMNLRHFLMSASVKSKMGHVSKFKFPFIAFFVTDETFAVSSSKQTRIESDYMLSLQIPSYLSWVAGSAAGYAAGNFIPEILINCMGIALYAMFIALLIPAVKKSRRNGIIAASAAILNTLLIKTELTGPNTSLIITIISIPLVFTLLSSGAEKNAK